MGKVYVEIGADQKALNKALANIKKQVAGVGKSLQTLGSRMAMAGASAVTAFVGATKVFANAGDALRDMSMRTGASVEALSSLGYVAAQSGTDLGTLEAGMRRMQKVVAAGRDGNKAAAEAFAQLGISLEELGQMTPDQQMLRIGDALASIPDPADRAAAAMKIFGKGGTALLPMLSEGSARIKEMQAEAERLGVVMSTEDANAADEFNDSLARLGYVVKGGANVIGASLAPAMTQLANTLAEVVGRVARFVRENQGLVRMALVAAGALTTAGAATWAVGTAMVAASNSFSSAAKAANMLLGPARLLSNIGTAVGQSFLIAASNVANFGTSAAVSLAGILGPIGLIGVAVAGIGIAVAAQSGAFSGLWTAAQNALQPIAGLAGEVGASIVATFQGFIADASVVFGDLWNISTTTFQGISDALAAGDLAGAAEMLWLGVQAAWLRGTSAIMGVMDPFITDIQNTWTYLSTEAANATDSLWSVVQQGFNTGVAAIGGVIDNLVTTTMNSFDYLVGEIQKSWNWVQSFFRQGFDLEAENAKVDNANAARKRDREMSNPGMAASLQAAGEKNAGVRSATQQRIDERNKAADATYLGRQAANDQRAKERGRQLTDVTEQMNAKANDMADARSNAEFFAKQKKNEKLASMVGGQDKQAKAEVAGSFSASNVGQIAFGKSLAQQQVDLLKRIADNTDEMGEAALVGE